MTPLKTTIGSKSDLKSNRLGLLSETQIPFIEQELIEIRKKVQILLGITGVLVFVLALITFRTFVSGRLVGQIAGFIILFMLVMSGRQFINWWHHLHHIETDLKGGSVRIANGRVSRTVVSFPDSLLYHYLKVEVRKYRVLNQDVYNSFRQSEHYYIYYLPLSGIIITAELERHRDAYST